MSRLAAGCSKGGLYHHFATKSAVLEGVVERLIRTNALLPPFEATPGELPLPPAAVGRVLIEVWAEAARSSRAAGAAARRVRSTTRRDAQRLVTAERGLAEILRIGTLIQLLARGRGDECDRGRGARHWGSRR